MSAADQDTAVDTTVPGHGTGAQNREGRPRRRLMVREAIIFAGVGAASTVVHLGLFVALRAGPAPAQAANTVALLLAAVVNTAANRRWTFGVRGRAGAARHQVQGLVVLGVTLAVTSGALWLLHAVRPDAATWAETAVLASATIGATGLKFAAMRVWMFPGRRAG